MPELKKVDEQNAVAEKASSPVAVQGIPWYGGPAQQPLALQSGSTTTQGVGQPSFALPCSISPPIEAQIAMEGQAPPSVEAQSRPAGHDNEQSSAPIMLQPSNEYVSPHTKLELGHSVAQTMYPYIDPLHPFYGNMMTAYGAQTMIHPHLIGIQQFRMPLPSEITEEEPVYVNAKQYRAILRRRQSRAKAEFENRLIKSRKPYLHESRHLHALRRARGCGGRFLNTKEKEESKDNSVEIASLEGQSSQNLAIGTHGETSIIVQEGSSGRVAVSTQENHENHLPNQAFLSSVFHTHAGGGSEIENGQVGMMSSGSHQRAVATQ